MFLIATEEEKQKVRDHVALNLDPEKLSADAIRVLLGRILATEEGMTQGLRIMRVAIECSRSVIADRIEHTTCDDIIETATQLILVREIRAMNVDEILFAPVPG